MFLHKGLESEYKKRHDEIWPELQALLKKTGISEYSIFLDETTNSLFGILQLDDPNAMDNLPSHPVMQRWWAYIQKFNFIRGRAQKSAGGSEMLREALQRLSEPPDTVPAKIPPLGLSTTPL